MIGYIVNPCFCFYPLLRESGGFHIYGVSLFMGLSLNHPFMFWIFHYKLFMFSIVGPFMDPPAKNVPMTSHEFSYDVPMIFQCFKPHVFPLCASSSSSSSSSSAACASLAIFAASWTFAGGSTRETKVNKHRCGHLKHASGWWLTYPTEKWWTSSVGMMKFPIYGNTCSKQPTNQPTNQGWEWSYLDNST